MAVSLLKKARGSSANDTEPVDVVDEEEGVGRVLSAIGRVPSGKCFSWECREKPGKAATARGTLKTASKSQPIRIHGTSETL